MLINNQGVLNKIYFLSICLCFYAFSTFGQGRLMLVGGGSEDEGGWSDTPYKWAVNTSSNKKVAIISYDDQDSFIPNYFISLGAISANNIKIDSREFADLQSTYDSLMKYDVYFFKGGDQSVYYTLYKDTKTTQAIIDKFNSGGVIAGTSAGMAILSTVIFTAEKGSAYPYDCLKNYKHSSVTLADDFLPLSDNFIFDTHFTERGRAFRLVTFMANRHDLSGEFITGVGVDDRTSLCIDENRIGTVYGTGTVSIFNSNSFTSIGNNLIADSVYCSQLLHGNSFDLKNLNIIDGPSDLIGPSIDSENGNYELMLSGGEGISANAGFITDFINRRQLDDTVVLVTSPGKGRDYLQALRDASVAVVLVETTAHINDADQYGIRNDIRNAKKVLFVENEDNSLFTFLKGGPTGKLIDGHCRRNNMLVAFAGQDSRYAGVTFPVNHLTDEYAAYYGRLEFKNGLALLKTSVIMPDSYNPNKMDFYENTTAAVPYAMFFDSLKFGFYLNRNSYLNYFQKEGRNYFSFKGDLTGIGLVNNGIPMARANQPVDSSGKTRNYVGFTGMKYVFMNGDRIIDAGQTKPFADVPYTYETTVKTEAPPDETLIKIFPNPSTNGIFRLVIRHQYCICFVAVHDIHGRLILSKPIGMSDETIDLSAFPNGVYLLYIDIVNGHSILKLVNRHE